MRLFFRKEGSGPALVILHGLYGSSDNWMIISKKLSAEFTVYSVDQRNHGHSPHLHEHTFEAMKEDLIGFYRENEIRDSILLGHSMGGKVAMAFAADYPELIKKLIVVDIAPVNYLETEEESQYFFHRNILLAMMEINFDRITTRQQVEEKLSEKIDELKTCQFLIKNIVFDKQTHRLKWRLNIEALYENLDEIVKGIDFRFFDGRIPINSYQVVFIRGKESPYVKDRYLPVIKQIYPDAEILDIPGAGHWLHAEKTELFLEAVNRCCQ
jgi:esterase